MWINLTFVLHGDLMKRISQVVLAVAAVALIAANLPEKVKPIPPDNPADVATLTGLLPPGHVKTDADNNVVEIGLDGPELQKDPRIAPALRRLRHVRRLGINRQADEVLRNVRDWRNVEDAQLGDDVTDDGLACLEGMRRLKFLQTYSEFVTDKGAKSIAKLKNIERLDLQRTGLTDAALKEFATMPELKIIELRDCHITDAGLEYLRGMKLEELNLYSTKITNRGIDRLTEMTTLKLLDVADTKVTQAGCAKLIKANPSLKLCGAQEKEIREVPDDPKDVAAIEAALGPDIMDKDNVTGNVHILELSSLRQERGVWMKHLKGLHSVNSVTLTAYEADDDDLALLAGMRSIERLTASDNKFSDAALKHVGSLTGLRYLDLSGCPNITSVGMKHLAELSKLEDLNLAGTAVGDEGLKYFANLKSLRGLDLRGTAVGDDGLAHLSKLKNLGGLVLGDTKVTDAGLANLAHLVNLQVLVLYGTQTTDAGLVHLYAMKKLRVFGWGAGMTLGGVKELKKHAPRVCVPETDAPATGQ
jgi:Leucine-rich repeat (LRR) protein